MATTTQSRRTAPTGSGSDADNSNAFQSFAEVSRQQMAAGAEALSTWFRAAQAFQRAQLHMGERAALLHSQAAENIRKATTPMELASIQSTLVVYELQEAMRYWQELATAMGSVGGEALRAAETSAGEPRAGTGTSPTAAMMGAAMNAAAPMADALQQMFAAPMKAAAAAAQH